MMILILENVMSVCSLKIMMIKTHPYNPPSPDICSLSRRNLRL